MSRLTLQQANTIVEVALKKAREMKTKPLTVAVLDDAGHVKALPIESGTVACHAIEEKRIPIEERAYAARQ